MFNAPYDRDRYPAAVWLKEIAHERAFSDYYIRQEKGFPTSFYSSVKVIFLWSFYHYTNIF